MNNPLISLVYISNRYGSLDVLKANMARQSIRDFELVFVDGLYSERKEEVKKHFDGYRVKHIDQNQLPIDGYLSRYFMLFLYLIGCIYFLEKVD